MSRNLRMINRNGLIGITFSMIGIGADTDRHRFRLQRAARLSAGSVHDSLSPCGYGRSVEPLRRIIQRKWPVASVLLLLTLCMKLAVPVGFMPVWSDNEVRLIVCDGMATPIETAVEAMHGMHGHHHHGHDGPTKSDAPCPFAGLAAPVLGGADPIQIALALVAILVTGLFAAVTTSLRATGHLRPPLRGPPATA